MNVFPVDNALQVFDRSFQVDVFDVDQVANVFEMLQYILGIELFHAEKFHGIDGILDFDVVRVMQLREGHSVAEDFRFG